MDEEDREALARDEQPFEHLVVQAVIQDILDELAPAMAGEPVQDVVVAINRRLAQAGIPEQPHRWVESMAERISTNCPPVADTKAAVDAIRRVESTEEVGATAGAIDTGIGVEAAPPEDSGTGGVSSR